MTKLLGKKKNEETMCNVASNDSVSEMPNLDGDRLNICLLLLLYLIQGVPIGISNAISIILQSKKLATYEEQAIFSTVNLPFSLKLIWAPLVDALYIQRIGRRKSWLIPLQLFMGIFWLILANNIDQWLPEEGKPNLMMLFIILLTLNMLSAVQDVAVDGWTLTILKKKNVSYGSPCQSVGWQAGVFIGFVCFTLLVSEQFWNTHFRTTPRTGGLITMKSFLYVPSIIAITIGTSIAVFKKEKDTRLEADFVKMTVFQSYKLLWDILKIRRMKILAVALLSIWIGYAAVESASKLKLIDSGVSKDDIMILTTAMYGLKFTMPIFVSKYVTHPKSMKYFMKITPIRLLWTINYALLIYFTPTLINRNGVQDVPWFYYLIFGAVHLSYEMMSFFMILSINAFFCQLSDPRYGGTYMTLFNTFVNLGSSVSGTIALKMISILTFIRCSNNTENKCTMLDSKTSCNLNTGSCKIYVDGFYIVVGVCMLVGFNWYFIFKNILKKYQSLGLSQWIVEDVKRSNDNDDSNELSVLNVA